MKLGKVKDEVKKPREQLAFVEAAYKDAQVMLREAKKLRPHIRRQAQRDSTRLDLAAPFSVCVARAGVAGSGHLLS